MLKEILSSLLVTGVIAATMVAPVLAALDVSTSPFEPGNGSHYRFSDSEKSGQPLQCEVNLLSKTGMGYLLFDANQCGGGFSLGRGHVVEPVVIGVTSPVPPVIPPPVLPPPVEPPVEPPQ
jgi:hypothetical protein